MASDPTALLFKDDEIIFDDGTRRFTYQSTSGWTETNGTLITSPEWDVNRIGAVRDATKADVGFTLQNAYAQGPSATRDPNRADEATALLNALRYSSPQSRPRALLKESYTNGDVWWRYGEWQEDDLPLSLADRVGVNAVFNQATDTIASLRLPHPTGDWWHPDQAASAVTYDLSNGAPVVIVDVQLSVSVATNHALVITLANGGDTWAITLASGGTEAVAGASPLRSGLYVADFANFSADESLATHQASTANQAIPTTGASATITWSGTGVASVADASRNISLGFGRYERVGQ